MLGSLHKAITAAAAALLSAGYAACACLSVAASTPSSHYGQAPAFAHLAHHEAAQEAGADGEDRDGHDGAPAPVDHSTCGHCAQAALAKPAAADGAKAAAEKAGGSIAKAPATAHVFVSPSNRVSSRYRLIWAAPPDPSPISLKIRLLI